MTVPPPRPADAAATPTGAKPAEAAPAAPTKTQATPPPAAIPEIGGRDGPDPARYGDWEVKGRCVDF